MGAVSISTGRVSTVKGGATSSFKSSRGRKDRKVVDVEVLAMATARRVIETLDAPNGSYKGKLRCDLKGARKRSSFKRWVVKRVPRDGLNQTQRDQIAQVAIGKLLQGGPTALLCHRVGGKHDFYEVTEAGRRFLNNANGIVAADGEVAA